MTDAEIKSLLVFIETSSQEILQAIKKYGSIYGAGNSVFWPRLEDQVLISEKLSDCLSGSVQLRWSRDFSASYLFLKNQHTKHPLTKRTIFEDIVATNGCLRSHGSSYGL